MQSLLAFLAVLAATNLSLEVSGNIYTCGHNLLQSCRNGDASKKKRRFVSQLMCIDLRRVQQKSTHPKNVTDCHALFQKCNKGFRIMFD